jgi:thiamine-monophosphate kinase
MVKAAGRLPPRYLGIGDDVAVVPVEGRKLVLKVDMLVERTDVPRGMTYGQAARKVVAMCVSDFAAKGVRPDSFMISLGIRRGTTSEQIEELAKGFGEAEKEWDVAMVGGDTNEAGELVVDCAMVGFASKVVKREGARPGDTLVVSGRFGLPPAGLRILAGSADASGGFGRSAVRSVLMPTPSLEVGLALAPYLSSSMDSSDGLARSVHTLASLGRVGFELDLLPAFKGLNAFAQDNGLDAADLVLYGGEEFVVVGTVSPGDLDRAARAVRRAGGELVAVGKANGQAGEVVLRRGKGTVRIPDRGWTHLG